MNLRLIRLIPALLILPLCTACSNLKPVATFGAGTTAVAASYRPIVENMEKFCLKSRVNETVLNAGDYNYKSLTDKAPGGCKDITDGKQILLEFATVVEGYGAILVELSGLKGDALSADITALTDTAAKLKGRSGDTLFDTNVLGAAAKLANAVIELVLSHKVTKVTKETLVDAHQPLSITVGSMKTFATRVYPPILNDYANHTALLESYLQNSSTWKRVDGNDSASALARDRAMPFRLQQAQVRAALVEVDEQRAAVEKFRVACDALLASHTELIEQFGAKTAPDKMAALKTFVERAKDLRDSIKKI